MFTDSASESGDASRETLVALQETQRRRLIAAGLFGSFLNIVLVGLLIASYGFELSTYGLDRPAGHALLSSAIYFVVMTVGLVLAIKRIAVPLVSRIAVGLIAITVLYDVAMAGGLFSVNGPILLILPAIASLILRPRDTIALAVLNAGGIIVIAALQYKGGILPEAELSGDVFLAAMAFVFISGSVAASGMAYVTVRNHENSEIRSSEFLKRSAQLTSKLNDERKRFEDFSDVASDWLFEVDMHGICTYSAGRLMESFRDGSARVVGLHRSKIIQPLIPGDTTMDTASSAREMLDMLHVVSCLEGEPVFHLRISAKPIYRDDGTYLGYRGVAEDITDSVKSDEQIRHMARHDSLTNLLNRNVVNDELEELNPKFDRYTATLIDLDGFKPVNDTYGHDIGDQVLQEVARRLTLCACEDSIVSRLGGDEFLILSPTGPHSHNLGQKVLAELSKTFELEGLELNISGSIGQAFFPDHADCGDQLLIKADLALYAAKNAGRDGCMVFETAMERRLQKRLRIEERLRKAIHKKSLKVLYQPQYALKDNRLIGFEALARWEDEDLGIVEPSEFIPIAEECGLIGELGALIFDTACRDAMTWPIQEGSAQPLNLSVNISPKQLLRPAILSDVQATLERTGFPASRLELEVTESVLIADKETASSILETMSGLGISIAIDDFGTGYSSLNYLTALPLNRLKIDRSFVNHLQNPSVARITQAIIQLGESLGIAAVAEGVETEEQFEALREMGCAEAQGFFYSQPVSLAETHRLIVLDQTHANRGVQHGSGSRPKHVLQASDQQSEISSGTQIIASKSA